MPRNKSLIKISTRDRRKGEVNTAFPDSVTQQNTFTFSHFHANAIETVAVQREIHCNPANVNVMQKMDVDLIIKIHFEAKLESDSNF